MLLLCASLHVPKIGREECSKSYAAAHRGLSWFLLARQSTEDDDVFVTFELLESTIPVRVGTPTLSSRLNPP